MSKLMKIVPGRLMLSQKLLIFVKINKGDDGVCFDI
jgi:hypothetical protein